MTTDTSTEKKEKLFLKNPGKGDYTKNLEEEKKQSSKHSSKWLSKIFHMHQFSNRSSVLGQSVFSYAACEHKPRSFKMCFLSESSVLYSPQLRSHLKPSKQRFGLCLGTVMFGESFFLQDAVHTCQYGTQDLWIISFQSFPMSSHLHKHHPCSQSNISGFYSHVVFSCLPLCFFSSAQSTLLSSNKSLSSLYTLTILKD